MKAESRRRGNRFQIEEQPCEDDGRYRCSLRFVRIDSFGSQDGGHVPDDETYYGHVAFVTEGASQMYKQTIKCVYLGATVFIPTILPKSTGACCGPNYVSEGIVFHGSTGPPHRSGLTLQMLRVEVMETMLCGWDTWSPTVAHLTVLRTSHHRLLLRCIGWKRKHRDGYHIYICLHQTQNWSKLDVRTSMRKRRILFEGFVANMRDERPPKRVMFGELEGGKGYLEGQEQDWMGCLERDPSLFHLPTEEKQRTLAAKKSGKWFRRFKEAAEQYMKRW